MRCVLSAVLLLAALATVAEASHNSVLRGRTHLNPSHHSGHRLQEQRAVDEEIDLQSQISGNGLVYPPAGTDPPTQIPQSWIDAYNTAKAAGKIPNIPPSVINNDTGLPEYPPGTPDPCSWSRTNCEDGDIWLAPPGKVGISFDDGPVPNGGPALAKYLKQESTTATHFLIGSAIIWNAATLKKMIATNPNLHFGLHTFTHTLQTTKTDMEIVGDLGWASQLILDVTGKVPMYWRAPEGDVDSRVRAIAKEVFGLQHVSWSKGKDADDWCLSEGHGVAKLDFCKQGPGKSYKSVVTTMESWAKNTSTDGWIGLEHETTDQSLKAFKAYHKALVKNDWQPMAIPELQGLPWYQNQFAMTDTPIPTKSILPTRPAIDVNDSSAPAGSSGAPNVSAFKNLGVSISQSSTAKSGSSTSAANQVAVSSLLPAALACIGVAVSLL